MILEILASANWHLETNLKQCALSYFSHLETNLEQCVYDLNFAALGNQFNAVCMLIIQILPPWIRCVFLFKKRGVSVCHLYFDNVEFV